MATPKSIYDFFEELGVNIVSSGETTIMNKTIQQTNTVPTNMVTYKDGRWVDASVPLGNIDGTTTIINTNWSELENLKNRVAALEGIIYSSKEENIDGLSVGTDKKQMALDKLLVQLKLLSEDPISGYVFVPNIIDAYKEYIVLE